MNTLYDFLTMLLLTGVVVGVILMAAAAIDWLVDVLRHDDLHDVFARDNAMVTLARIHAGTVAEGVVPDPGQPVPGLAERCARCGHVALTENLDGGLCDDCWALLEEATPRCDACGIAAEETPDWCGECGNCLDHCAEYVTCERARAAEWEALMHAVEDEQVEQEDHR